MDNENKLVEDKLLNPDLASKTLEMNELCRELSAKGVDVCKTGFGKSPFPIPEGIVEELKKNAHQNMYLPVKGHHLLRESICEFVEKTNNAKFHPDNILVAPGSKMILSNLIGVLECEFIIPTPCWVTYIPNCVIRNKPYQVIHTKKENKWFPTAEELDEACKKSVKRKCLIFTCPNNPTGTSLEKEELLKLVPVLRKHQVVVISDEIYSQFYQSSHMSSSFSHPDLYPEGTIVTGGLSKVLGAGGWRLGYCCVPEQLKVIIKPMCVWGSNTYSCAPAPMQFASIVALKDGNSEVDEYLENCRRILDGVRNEVYRRVNDAGIITVFPMGGFYFYLVFDNYRSKLEEKYGIKSSTDLAEVLLKEKGVASLGGVVFYRDPRELGIRYCLTCWDGAESLKEYGKLKKEKNIVEVDEEFVKKFCDPILKATDIICEFVKEL